MTEKYTMSGYSFKEWARRNKETFKLVLTAVLGLGTYFSLGLDEPWKALAATMIGLGTKLAVDAIDYWLKE